jgi:acyl-CoA dehydrogenase
LIRAPTNSVFAGQDEAEVSPWGDDIDIAGQKIDSVQRFPISADLVGEFWLRGALARSVQMVGAMSRAVDLTIVYAHERHQFGRPIAHFQAVRDHLAVAARELALARAAVRAAIQSTARKDDLGVVRSVTAVAKAMANRASIEVTRRAHQVHGAIGTTREYPLHRLTLQLAAWRDDFGTEQEWESWVGRVVAAADVEHVWDFVTQIEVAG